MTRRRTVLVSAGTYHLPFHRLVDWMQPWVLEHGDVRVIMQHGPGKTLDGAENYAMVPYGELLALMAEADAIVLQGGAGGVMDARALGRIPILVPRVPIDDEVVDDHQLVFTHRIAELGLARRATTANDLWRLLDAALAGTIETRSGPAEATAGVLEFERLLEAPQPRLPGAVRLRRATSLAGTLARSTLGRRSRSAGPAPIPSPAPIPATGKAADDKPGGVDPEL